MPLSRKKIINKSFGVDLVETVSPPKGTQYSSWGLITNESRAFAAASFTAELRLGLAPGGVTHTTEVLSYDFYDFVGNVGGFLGLCLGASILSIYDEAGAAIARFKSKGA